MQSYNDLDSNTNFDDIFAKKIEKNEINNEAMEDNRFKAIALLFLVIVFLFVLFLIVLYVNVTSTRKLPTLEITKKEIGQRGTIYSNDGFNLSSSKNLYKVSVLKNSIDPDKMQFFIKLMSIYSGMSEDEIRTKMRGRGNIILSYNVSPKTALNLKQLNAKLIKYGVFRSYEENGKIIPKSGLSVDISGESRDYLYKDLTEPILGYTNKLETDGYTKPKGIKGIEKFYNDTLESKQDGIYRGYRDIGFNIILDKKSKLKQVLDGQNVVLTIPLKLQKKIENIVDEAAKDLSAKEVIVGVIDSNTGRILSLASSNRFDPKNIREEDYTHLNSDAVELSFEPGSILKPIIYSILLEKRLVNPNEIFNLHNGVYKLGKYTIRDSIGRKYSTAENIIVYSSNIGMSQMSQRLDAKTYYNALLAFGFSLPTNIDLPYEKTGVIPSKETLNSYVYKASVSYGYGIRATFIQMLRAYAVFANGGYLINPYLRDYTLTANNQKIDINSSNKRIQILSPYTIDTIDKTLIKTVQYGTAKQAGVDGIIVGGKTGTARIATTGKYEDKYIGSFFGFARGKKANYTIGVVVYESGANTGYYAAQTATPVAKKVIEALIDDGYLKQIE